jgi:hypothetical protein
MRARKAAEKRDTYQEKSINEGVHHLHRTAEDVLGTKFE